MFTHIQVFANTFGPNEALLVDERSSRREKLLPFPALPKCRTLKNISVLFSFFLFGSVLPLPFLLFLFLSRLRSLRMTLWSGGQRVLDECEQEEQAPFIQHFVHGGTRSMSCV